MKIGLEKRRRGRPPKPKGSITPWQFARVALVSCAYDEARRKGEKHSSAVRYAVDVVKKCNPELSISETEVRRSLATFSPKGGELVLRFEWSSLTKEDIETNRLIQKAFAEFQGKKGLALVPPPVYEPIRGLLTFSIGFGDRPEYPRHNRKQSGN